MVAVKKKFWMQFVRNLTDIRFRDAHKFKNIYISFLLEIVSHWHIVAMIINFMIGS